METRYKSKLRGPLPGGNRRGTPGADAGCSSLRPVSGEELSRRAPTGDSQSEHITAAITGLDRQTDSRSNSSCEPYSPSTTSYNPSVQSSPSTSGHIDSQMPALDVAQEANAFLPASTKAGKTRVRMKWSNEVNLFIMRTYYYITKLETDFTIYRKKLHELFSFKYPNVNVSQQRISDQKRSIERNKLISQEDLNRLKEDVKKQLQDEDTNSPNENLNLEESTHSHAHIPPPSQITLFHQHTSTLHNTHTSHASTQTESVTLLIENNVDILDYNPSNIESYAREIKDKFRTTLTLYSGMDPTARPILPKLKYSRKLTELIHLFNFDILLEYILPDSELTDLHTLIYCTAVVIAEELNYKITHNSQNRRRKEEDRPPWQRRIEDDIIKLRADIGKLTQYINNNRSKKVVKRVEAIFRNTMLHTRHENSNKKPEEFLDTLKQKLALKAHRLKRYKKAQQRITDNSIFATNEKQFYRKIMKPQVDTNSGSVETPTTEQLEEFWSGIWEDQIQHNDKADWIIKEKQRWNTIEEMQFNEVTEHEITNITSGLHNWKSPGIDKIHNFWYKKLTSLHKIIAINLTNIISGKQSIPEFIATGITYMLPKNNYSSQPSQYRPITCLPTIYKILTSVITNKINSHIEQHNIIAEEQKGCRRGHMGCKEQLIIDSVIMKHATSRNRNLHCTYIDYKKAFDSIPHSWLTQVLEIYKVHHTIIDFLRNIMTHWKTTLHLNSPHSLIKTRQIAIRKGIYQGDSLSPLWFCLALNPLSHQLKNVRAGYHLKHNSTETIISHLIYMDDIKLYAKSDKEMKTLLKTTSEFSKDINMHFGLDKCKTVHILKGKVRPGDYVVNDTDIIIAMELTDLYKYLGYQQLKGLDHTSIKQTLTTEYKKRTNAICKTQLSGKHLIKALNTYAIPILTYSFGIVKWSKTDIDKIERMTRTTLTKHNYLHPKSAIERLTIKRQDGGRGLIDIYHLWQKQIYNLRIFFHMKSQTSEIHKAITQHDKNFTPLNLEEQTGLDNPNNRDPQKRKVEEWKKKVLHGRHPHDLSQPHVDSIASNMWLKTGNLFPETEGFLVAIQDQVINTKNYRKHIIKDPTATDDKCRKCNTQSETIQHITGACPSLTQTDYTHRHNQLANIIHQTLAHKHKLIQYTRINTPYYKYTPQTVLENDSYKLYYDRAILTDRTIHYNRPDITLQDKNNKITYLIDIAVPNTHNLQKTVTDKISKYTELKEEIARIWKQHKVFIVPIVISTTGVVPNHIRSSLKLLDLKETLYISLQKAAILNTCRIVRKFLQLE